ncbi:2-dehydro-3-deoxy-D-gluconate 5-dehydrogenase KduD [Lactobacillus corticis]|uniref:Gluconate 5-dehydrogenase n=1 Tax=Lactobacillus corticis TaxID=2201249 RepID=A0A916QKS4_9LACO|nr:2-dehydro-3-deoxy-D-gluconate 5-dehydrogenase KduD [Lactobacillus corticis]GFZ27430.1 gluconate 5-dehydrogenase [Lactobacillus corticis]
MSEIHETEKEIKQHEEELKNNFSMDKFSLKGKVAVITGGNTGLGQGYAIAMAKAGADIFIPTFGKKEWKNTQEIIESVGQKVEFLDCDLTKPGEPEKVIEEAIARMGHIDILVNNAGMIKRNPILESKDEDWDKVIAINLSAVYHMSLAASKVFAKQNSGRIINIGSMLSFQGGKFIPSYTASKHGVAGLTKAFASEMGAYNVTVNAIAPGYIKTENTAPIRAQKERNEEILSRIPMGHWADPYELMGPAVFLASDAAAYINGAIIPVDGGYLVR